MGAGLSKHEDEVKAENLERAAASAKKSLSKDDDNEATPISAAGDAVAPSPESGCPMKRKDGSYTFDWGAMFRPQFPHGPSGKLPLKEEQVREKMGTPVETTTTTKNPKITPAAVLSGGCPVKHQEYNVYSQPIDPKNNMPQTANQLRGPGQTKDLPTDRVKSSIPKVRYVLGKRT
jgi:hypothetical protein